jgi:type IV pilus assembly protein PilC
MLQAGISLPDGLAYLVKGEVNPALTRVLEDCLDTLLKGYPLSQGMRRAPTTFSPMLVEMVATGESTGALAQTLGQLAHLQERSQDRVQRVKSALAYPTCLFVIMLLVMGLFVTVVAPGDQGMFGVLGDNIPWPSQVLISLSRLLGNPWLMLTLLALLAGLVEVCRRAYQRSSRLRLSMDSFCLRLPVVGRLLVGLDAARALEVLYSSLKVGLSIVQALKNAIRVVQNERFRQDLVAANHAVMNGRGLGVALAENTRLPRFATSLIEVCEEAGELDSALERVAAALDEQVNDALNRAVALAEPLLLCLGGLAAGFIAVATFLPIMRLLSTL